MTSTDLSTFDHFDTLRRLREDPELGTDVAFMAFGLKRVGLIVGRVGKPGQAGTDPVAAYRLPSHSPQDVELFRVLRNEAPDWRGLPAGIPPARRLNGSELRNADIAGPAFRLAVRALDVLAKIGCSPKVRARAAAGSADRLAQAIGFERRAAAWDRSKRVEALPDAPAAVSNFLAKAVGYRPG